MFRAVPVLTQLFIIYFGLAAIGIRLSPIPAAIAGFGLNGGAYLTEVFRGGIDAVGRGQVEAAHALGMGRLPGLILVVLPQAFRITLPSLTIATSTRPSTDPVAARANGAALACQ